MTEYQKNLPVSAIAYPPDFITNSMPEAIYKSGLKQFHLQKVRRREW